MAESVVVREGELLIYKNQLVRYAEFLAEKSREFTKVLHDVQSFAFVDIQLASRLALLLLTAMPQIREMDQAIGTELQAGIQELVSELERADSFQYPESILDRVKALLSVFG